MPTREGRREKGPSFVVRMSVGRDIGEKGNGGKCPRGPTMPIGSYLVSKKTLILEDTSEAFLTWNGK